MSRLHLYFLVAILSVGAGGFFLFKVFFFGFPLIPGQSSDVWRVEVQLAFEAQGGPVKLSMFVPYGTGGLAIIDQNFVSPGYGLTTNPEPGAGMRAVYSIREASGQQVVYYRAAVQRMHLVEHAVDPRPAIAATAFEGAEAVAAKAIVDAAVRQSSDAGTLAALIVKRLKEAHSGDEADLLVGRQPGDARIAGVAVKLLQNAGIAARIVNGLALAPERREAVFVRWLEYYEVRRWTPVYVSDSPADKRDLLPWWRGSLPLVEATGVQHLRYTVSTSRAYEVATRAALQAQRDLEEKLIEFSLFGLPLQAQALFRTLLVIPVGILLLVVLRNVVGMKTFGTFMPVLIALAFRQTGLLWGLIFFTIILAVGLTIRLYLEQLKLLLVPRLAAVVIVVILTLAVLTVLSYRLGFERGLSVGLFPIVILTMTIERMTLVWEERGAGEALQQAAGSFAVGALCYVVMNLRIVEHLFFVFPELLLIVLSITLLLGRYTGYRLTELRRFRALAK